MLPMIIALDTDKIPMRLLCASIDEGDEGIPFVLESRSFRSTRGFCQHWNRYYARLSCPIHVAVPQDTKDPLNVIPWLNGQGVQVETYVWAGHIGDVEFDIWGLKRVYLRVYTLALAAGYRIQSHDVVNRLWSNMAMIQGQLKDVVFDLQRLSAAHSQPPKQEKEIECPF